LKLSYPCAVVGKPVFSVGAQELSPDPISGLVALNREWAALIARVAQGDQEALTILYDQSSRFIYGLLLRMLGNAATAEEVLLDVYTQVWRKGVQYDSQRGNPRAWLVTMARSRAIDRLRADRQVTQREGSLDERATIATTQVPEQMAAHSEIHRLVTTALGDLSPEEREVIELAFYSGLTHREMAAHLHQPLGTVKTRVRRGMMKLRELLGPVLEGNR
jgi:RNA polymerase sigma-70 factor, ECF subfamily